MDILLLVLLVRGLALNQTESIISTKRENKTYLNTCSELQIFISFSISVNNYSFGGKLLDNVNVVFKFALNDLATWRPVWYNSIEPKCYETYNSTRSTCITRYTELHMWYPNVSNNRREIRHYTSHDVNIPFTSCASQKVVWKSTSEKYLSYTSEVDCSHSGGEVYSCVLTVLSRK